MFEELFERSHAIIRHQRSPLATERRQYLAYLTDKEMAPRTIREVAFYTVVVAERLRLSNRPKEIILLSEIRRQATSWSRKQCQRRATVCGENSRRRFIKHATRWLRFLGRLEKPPKKTLHKYVTAFAEYMREERGLSSHTITYRCSAIQEFLNELKRRHQSLRGISARDIDEILLWKVAKYSYARITVQTYASTLRSFLSYAERQQWCRNGLGAAIRAPRVFRHESLPIGPSWKEVQQLVAISKKKTLSDIRHRAILMLFSIYALRVGELVGLRLDDFDWEKELLMVRRPKQRHAQLYPLLQSVGDAVLSYIKEVRPPSKHREVFLTCRAPYRPLTTGAVGQIVSRRLRAINNKLPHYGPHALRHACAGYLLSQGLSLKEIGDHLGHKDPETTRIYAKVDIKQLREVGNFDLGGLV